MTSIQFLELAVSLSVQVAIVVSAAYWLARTVGNEQTKCHIWAACHALLLCLVIAGLVFPYWRVFHPWGGVDRQSAVTLLDAQQELGRILFLVWLAGFLCALGMFVVRTVRIENFVRACNDIDADSLSIQCDGKILTIKGSGRARRARLLSSDAVAAPFCWQFHRPYIVVPDFLLTLDEEQLRYIIRHELEHLESGHPVQLFVQRVVEMIYWFHPMVWWSSQQSALAREFACDAAVVDSPQEMSKYLTALLTVIQIGSTRPDAPSSSMSFGRGKSMIARRAQRMVAMARGGGPSSSPRLSSAFACMCLIAVAGVVACVRLPIDIRASTQTAWSPWPTWTAGVLHDFGIHARDFEAYDYRLEELNESLPENRHRDD